MCRRRIEPTAGIINFVQSRPIDRTQTHRTRFATGIEGASVQPEIIEGFTGLPDRHDFRMRRWVVVQGDFVCAGGNHTVIFYDDCAIRPAFPAFNIGRRQFDGLLEEGKMHGHS